MNWAGVRCFSGLAAFHASCSGFSGLSCILLSLRRTDFDDAGDLFGLRAQQGDDQHAVLQFRLFDNNAISEKEVSLKLARCDAAVKILPVRLILLAAPDDQLVVLGNDVELTLGKAGYGNGDEKFLSSVRILGAFDVI